MTNTAETNGAVSEAGGIQLDLAALSVIAADRKTIPVVVNQKGDFVYVTELSGTDRDWFEAQMPRPGENRKAEGTIAKLIACGLTREDGSKLFGRNQWPQIQSWKSSLQQRLFDAICDVSGISERAREDFLSTSKPIASDD